MKGNEVKRAKIRKQGIEYIRFFLESVPVWASWVPQDVEDEGMSSLFEKGYRMLKQGGLEFPIENDYIVYTEHNVEKRYGL